MQLPLARSYVGADFPSKNQHYPNHDKTGVTIATPVLSKLHLLFYNPLLFGTGAFISGFPSRLTDKRTAAVRHLMLL